MRVLYQIGLTALFWGLAGIEIIEAQSPTILVVESYHAEYSWDISYKKGIEDTLGDAYSLIYFQMDTKRLPESLYQRQADLAYNEYEHLRPALVILGDDNALRFLGPRLARTQTPVVYLGINNNPRDYGLAGKVNITGVLERPLAKRSIVYLNELLKPKPKKILILFDSGHTSRVSAREMFEQKERSVLAGIEVDVKLIGRMDEWKNTVLAAKRNGYDAAVIGLYHTLVDKDGRHVNAADVLAWTSEHIPVPPFAFWDFAVGSNKTIGGLVLFGQTQGEAAARLARQILEGTPPIELPPVVGKKGRFLFSQSQMEKWKIFLSERVARGASIID